MNIADNKIPLEKTNRDLNKIKTGDLLAWGSDSLEGKSRFINKFIEVMTGSSFSHVGIAIDAGNHIAVIEASYPRIRLTPLSSKPRFYWIPMNVENNQDILKLYPEYLDKEYSMLDCIRAYLGFKIDGNESYQCAELANELYKRSGVHLNPKRLTPRHIVKASMIYSQQGLYLL